MAGGNIAQGVLNRVRSSVNFANNTLLNITAPYLGKAGISAVPISGTAVWIPTMTGGVPSLEPYQQMRITIHLLRTQAFGAAWRAQVESTCLVGDMTVISDATNQPNYKYLNGVVTNSTNPAFNGTDPEMVIEIEAAYPINSSLFNS